MKQWTQWKLISLTVSAGIFSCVIVKSLICCSGFSSFVSGCSRLSLMLCYYKFRRDSSIFLFSLVIASTLVVSAETESQRQLFSLASIVIRSWLNSKLCCSCWNSLCFVSTSIILESRLKSFSLIESKISLTSETLDFSGELWMESNYLLPLGRSLC